MHFILNIMFDEKSLSLNYKNKAKNKKMKMI